MTSESETRINRSQSPARCASHSVPAGLNMRAPGMVLRISPVVCICCYALFNPLIAQAGWFFFPDGIAGLTLMQWWQGLFLIAVLPQITFGLKRQIFPSKLLLSLLLLYGVGLTVIHLRVSCVNAIAPEYIRTERLWYFKIVFSMTLWYYVALAVRDRHQAFSVLKFMVLGSVLTAVCILYFYIIVGGNVDVYARHGVTASFGAEGVSGKATTGFLVPSVFVAIYLWIKRKLRHGWLFAVVILIGALVTFNRSAQVAFVLALLSLLFWFWRLSRQRRGYFRIAVIACILIGSVIAVIYFVGVDQLVARWTYDYSKGSIGSGRLLFYKCSIQWFLNEPALGNIMLGMGYGNIHNLMYEATRMHVHTHSDLFDMLLAGGLLGVGMYGTLFYAARRLLKAVGRHTIGYGIMCSIIASFFVFSMMTGVLGATHAMFCFMGSLICIKTAEAHHAPSGTCSSRVGREEWQA